MSETTVRITRFPGARIAEYGTWRLIRRARTVERQRATRGLAGWFVLPEDEALPPAVELLLMAAVAA